MLRQGLLALLLFTPLTQATEDRFAKVTIESQPVAEGIHILTGAGGNIGVSAGADGLLIIDNQFAPLADKIGAALATIQPGPVKYIVNTHYHGDHIGGNAHFAEAGTVFAHHKVLERLLNNDKLVPAALPVVTYEDGIRFRFNDQDIRVIHLGPGHTDGDSLVWFEKANVLHMGDLYFKDRFPYVDQDAGGTVEGYAARVREALSWVDDDTRIIPGHGDLATKAELQAFLTMLETCLAWAEEMKGQALTDWQKQGVPEAYKDWGWNFIGESRWIQTLYREVQD